MPDTAAPITRPAASRGRSLWFTVGLDKLLPRLAAGLVMGAAVSGMHYTGMAAVRVHLDPAAPDPSGTEVFSFLFPVFVLAALAMAVPICAVLMATASSEAPRHTTVAP